MGVLRVQSFRRLLASYAANQLAWSVANLALSLLIFRQTGSAWASTGFFLVSEFLPAFVAPRLVVALERMASQKVLAGAYAAQAILFLVLAAAPRHFLLGAVLGVVFLCGVLGVVASPFLRTATVQVTSPQGLLQRGNAVLNGVFAVSVLVGPLLGSLVISSVNFSVCILMVSALFLCMAIAMFRAPDFPERSPTHSESEHRLRDALRYVRADRLIRRILAFQMVGLVFFSVATPIEVVLAERALHAGAAGYAALLSAWGAGAIVGSAGYARWPRVPGWAMMAFGSACIGVAFIVMGSAASIWPAIAGAVVGGIGNGTEAVAQRTTLQQCVTERWMTLIQSFNESIMQAVPGVGFLLGGALTTLAGVRPAFIVGGIGGLIVALSAPLVLRWPLGRSSVADGQELLPELARQDETLGI